jgi:two-component system NtrC family sensor kinase
MPVAESIDQDVLLRTIDRERQSRLMSERLLEDKSRALYLSKEKVQEQYESLKQTQGQLLHSEKMASVGQLAAGVAHEINNPIGFVTSNVQTLTDLLKESYDGLVRVREIVQNLKSFVHLDKSEVQLADINEGLEATLKVVWNELKYKCQVEKKFGDLPRVRCFAGERNQVFLNLIVNAAQAIEGQGVVTITTDADTDNAFVRISDTGRGIPEEHLAQLFDPFFTTKPVGEGTGLGLSVSYGIVRKHDGDITVDSAVGKGTTFTVRLPLSGVVSED